jgi:putative transposase
MFFKSLLSRSLPEKEEKIRTSREIFNTDQEVQFTSTMFVDAVLSRSIWLSMDGKGRALDNVFVERFWRSLKYEEVYLRDYETLSEARDHIARYCSFYNTKRPYQSLGYYTPIEVHQHP